MRGTMAGKLLVVSIVFSITAVCVIAVATAGSEGYRQVTEVPAPLWEGPGSPKAKVSLPPQDARRLAVEKATKERDSRIVQPPAAPSFAPPHSSAPPRFSAPPSTPVDAAMQQKESIPAAAEMDEYEVLASEFLGDPADSLGTAHSAVLADESVSQEARSAVERDRIEREMIKLKGEMFRRMNTVATRLRLDQYQRESITQITEQTLEQIKSAREQFASSEMTDYDKQVMQSQIRDIYKSAGENIKYALGDEKYKEFRKESAYYKNPERRLYDMQKTIEQQKKQLQQIERKVNQPRKK